MTNTSLNCKDIDFKTLEKIIFDFVCSIGRMMFRWALMSLDKELMKKRDKKAYRHKGKKKTCIKTLLGPVEFEKIIYEHENVDGQKEYVFLLDRYLKLETIGFMSPNLVEKVVENASNVSYRKAAENVTELTGQDISHGAVWNIVQELGRRISKSEKEKVAEYKAGELHGQKEVKVLFEEADGLWLSMQGKDRPKQGKGRKKEIKLAVTYEGWERRNSKEEAYEVRNKRVTAGFMGAEEFKDLRDARISEEYNLEKLEYRIVNGDGASWIKNGLDQEGCIFQLDPFHISKAVLRQVYDKKEAGKLLRMLKAGQITEAFKRINELKYECGGEADKVKKLVELEEYLSNNREGLLPYKMREGINLPEPPEGLQYRSLGTMEHNIFDVLGHRMKGRKMSWSIKGADNLSKILASKASGELYETISAMLTPVISERLTERFNEVIKRVAEKIERPSKDKKQYAIHHASIPFTGCALTEGRKAIRNIFNEKTATELVYR